MADTRPTWQRLEDHVNEKNQPGGALRHVRGMQERLLKPNYAVLTGLSASAGSANGTVVDVGVAFDQGALNNNFRDLVEKNNEAIARINELSTEVERIVRVLQAAGIVLL